MPTLQEQLESSTAQVVADAAKLHDIVHGGPTTDVVTEGGTVPSVAKAVASIGATVIAEAETARAAAVTARTGAETAQVAAGAARDVAVAAADDAAATLAGALVASNNLSDVANAATARDNLGVPAIADIPGGLADRLRWLEVNLALNTVRDVIDAGWTTLAMVDGFADEFNDQSGLSVPHFNVTSQVSATSASSTFGGSYVPQNPLTGVAEGWASQNGAGVGAWWQATFPTAVTLSRWDVAVGVDGTSITATVIPQYYNGSAWVDLASPGVINGSSPSSPYSFTFDPVTATQFRLFYTEAQSGTYAYLRRVWFYEGSATGISTGQTYDAAGDFYSSQKASDNLGPSSRWSQSGTYPALDSFAGGTIDGNGGNAGAFIGPFSGDFTLSFGVLNSSWITEVAIVPAAELADLTAAINNATAGNRIYATSFNQGATGIAGAVALVPNAGAYGGVWFNGVHAHVSTANSDSNTFAIQRAGANVEVRRSGVTFHTAAFGTGDFYIWFAHADNTNPQLTNALLSYASGQNMTLVSDALAAGATPVAARAVLLVDPLDAPLTQAIASGVGTPTTSFTTNTGAWTDGNTAQTNGAGSLTAGGVNSGYGQKQWPSARGVKKVRVWRPTDSGFDGAAGGATITVAVHGSSTGAFAGEQVLLGTGTATDYDGARGGVGAAAPTASYDFIEVPISDVAYAYHRATLSTTAAQEVRVAEIQFFEETPAQTVTLNTDLICEISRDDGTTWTAGVLTYEADYSAAVQILATDEIDLTGQPSGTEVRLRVRAPTSKAVQVHAWTAQWR